ncbi:MAG: UDP-N-acetylmuramoyl-L-alanyl-D-glutamate--2,6-diaminopimelate ligase [Acidimicrobiia bacterium]
MVSVGKTVGELASRVRGEVSGPGEALVTAITHDSRQVGPGSLFVAVRGSTADGHDFVLDAVKAGAVAVCVDHPMGSGVSEVVVADTRQAMGPLADAVYDHPSRALSVVGVTGTNGKTTVTHYIESISAAAGLQTGLIGTIASRVGGVIVPSERTTPEAPDFQRMLRRMSDLGAQLVATEVSSHALALHRVDATKFAVAAFTNLSQDHLDFHGDMASYFQAKMRLFQQLEVGTAVVNIDDPAGREIAGRFSGNLLTVGESGDISWTAVRHGPAGTSFELRTPWGTGLVDAPVLGLFNVENAVMAAASCLVLGLGLDTVMAGLESLRQVPGRFELVSGDDPIRIVVDYAHTPTAVELAVDSARQSGAGRVIAVLGAGGDRDRTKRPLMGRALATADFAIVTSDNPRHEDPAVIVAQVLEGIPPGSDHEVEIDRRRAIRRAIDAAVAGDTVLILGRGHEPFQEVDGGRIPFDDREVSTRALEDLRNSAASGGDSGSMRR